MVLTVVSMNLELAECHLQTLHAAPATRELLCNIGDCC